MTGVKKNLRNKNGHRQSKKREKNVMTIAMDEEREDEDEEAEEAVDMKRDQCRLMYDDDDDDGDDDDDDDDDDDCFLPSQNMSLVNP